MKFFIFIEIVEIIYLHYSREYFSRWRLNVSHKRKCGSVSISFSLNGLSHSFISSLWCLPFSIDNSWFDRRILAQSYPLCSLWISNILRILLLFLVWRKFLICSDRNWFLRCFLGGNHLSIFQKQSFGCFQCRSQILYTNRIQGVSSQNLPREMLHV